MNIWTGQLIVPMKNSTPIEIFTSLVSGWTKPVAAIELSHLMMVRGGKEKNAAVPTLITIAGKELCYIYVAL